MFEGELDESKWMIDDTNANELIEALNYAQNDWLLEEELMGFIENNNNSQTNGSDDNKIVLPNQKPWSELKYQVFDLLVEEKKIRFKELIHEHHSMHVERVSRFLNILNREITENNMPE